MKRKRILSFALSLALILAPAAPGYADAPDAPDDISFVIADPGDEAPILSEDEDLVFFEEDSDILDDNASSEDDFGDMNDVDPDAVTFDDLTEDEADSDSTSEDAAFTGGEDDDSDSIFEYTDPEEAELPDASFEEDTELPEDTAPEDESAPEGISEESEYTEMADDAEAALAGDANTNIEDYEREQDRSILPGWGGDVNSRYNVYVENSTYPDGRDFQYEVTDAKIISQSPADGSGNVLSIRKDTNENNPEDYWWHYDALEGGKAVIRVTYKKLDGKSASYDFTVFVESDVYEVHADTEDGSYRFMPSETAALVAEAFHYSTDESRDGNISGLTVKWSQNSESKNYAKLTPDSKNSFRATVKFTLPSGEDFFDNIIITASLCRGSEVLATENLRLLAANGYLELWPARINSAMNPGESETITAEVHLKPSDSPAGYDIANNVRYEWYYDPNAVEILDSAGTKVGNDDGNGHYNGSDKSTGSSVNFTIRRLREWGTDIFLNSFWTNEHGDEIQDIRVYHLDNKDYNVWFDWQGPNRVYSDGTRSFTLNQDNLKGLSYDVKLTVGNFDDDRWTRVFTKGTEYTFDGTKLTLVGNKIPTDGDNWIHIEAEILLGGASVAFAYADFEFRQAEVQYHMEEDRDMLPGWDGGVDHWYDGYMETSAEPDGRDFEYEVTDVSIMSQNSSNGSGDVLFFEKQFEDDNPSSGNYWWYYRALRHGDATLRVSYKDAEGKARSYDFNIHVGTDVYGVDLWSENGSDRALPGKTMTLLADAWHESENDSSTAGITYKWNLKEDGGFASLKVDASNPKKAYLSFRKPNSGEQYFWNDVLVEVIIFDGKDGSGNPIERTRTERWYHVSDDYTEVYPAEINSELKMWDIVSVNCEVRRYKYGQSSYEVLKGIHYRWYYDENAVEILDKNGKIVGNDRNGSYRDSAASTGSTCKFTIRRIADWDTHITLFAEWEDDEHREERRDFGLERVDYVLPPQNLTVKAAASSVAVGKTTKLTVTGAKTKLSYASSDKSVATVSSSGVVTAKKVGTAKITVTAAANSSYSKTSKTVTIKVVPGATTAISAENTASGVKVSWKKVTGATGYKLYRNSKLIKTIASGSTVTFTDKGAKTNGTKYVFKVVATAKTGASTLSKSATHYYVAAPAISSLTKGSKKFTVKWKKNAKASGYQVQYSTSKTFKSGNKTKTVTGASKVSLTVTGLAAGKKYYVRLRAYKTVSGKKYYSAWGAAKS